MKAKRSSYSPRYEGNGCGGQMPPKKELSANTLPAKVPAEPKTEGFSAGYLTPLINSVTLPANSPATKADIAEVITAVLTLASTC